MHIEHLHDSDFIQVWHILVDTKSGNHSSNASQVLLFDHADDANADAAPRGPERFPAPHQLTRVPTEETTQRMKNQPLPWPTAAMLGTRRLPRQEG